MSKDRVTAESGEQVRIVVVEDERIVALDIRAHLQRFGYTVAAVYASGEQMLSNIDIDDPNLVLMDIQIQGDLDGVETAERIHAGYDIPVILLTAYSDDATLERAKLTKPFAYIIKPFEERELRTAIVIGLYRHDMEQKLAAREKLLNTTLNSIGDGVVVCDLHDSVEFANPVARRLGGLSDHFAGGESFDSLLPLRESPTTAWPKGCETNGRVLGRPDAAGIPVELLETPLVDERGRRTGTVYVLRDLRKQIATEKALYEREEQLRQAQKMEAVGRLSGGVAHDFNNLLTVILGYSKLILEGIESEKGIGLPEIKADILGIQNASSRSVALTRQLLAFSRNQVLKPSTVLVNDIVRDVEKMLRRLLNEVVTMHVSLSENNPTVLVDQGQMEQVLMNLVVNARDAMPDGGTVTISVDEEHVDAPRAVSTGELEAGEWVRIRVQDTGVGIAPEHLPRVFEPFYSTKSLAKGTGLGLATVYGIVRQLDGHINVESELNRGTEFRIYLRKADQEAGSERAAEEVSTTHEGSERILLVEDEEPVRALISRVLMQHGYHVVEAQNAGEALLLVEESDKAIDMLVTDLIMPHVTGIALAKRLLVARPGLKVLLITGYSEELAELKSEERKLGLPVMQKPFTPSEFLGTVRRLLDE